MSHKPYRVNNEMHSYISMRFSRLSTWPSRSGIKSAYPRFMMNTHPLQTYGLALFLFAIGLILPLPVLTQSTSIPPSSLPTTPLSSNGHDGHAPSSCDLCRSVEGRPGSDLRPHRRFRDKSLHPQKKAKGISKSPKQRLMNQLPHRKLKQENGSE